MSSTRKFATPMQVQTHRELQQHDHAGTRVGRRGE
jgi:hypothetical protein